MCGSCDNNDMREGNELFGELYRLNYDITYKDTFENILKQLRHDACFKPELRKYSIKLDEFTHEWMQQMTSVNIECYRRPPDGCLPYRYIESNITKEQAESMTMEELEQAVNDMYRAPKMSDHVDGDESTEIIRPPLFTSYIVQKRCPFLFKNDALNELRSELEILIKKMNIEERRCRFIKDSREALDALVNIGAPGGICDDISSIQKKIDQMKKSIRLNKKICYRICF